LTREPEWLLTSIVLAVQQALIAEHGGAQGVRDKGLLESALHRPLHLYIYAEGATLFDLAASYAYGLARNHCFVDGNKRIALATSFTFLSLNGLRVTAPREERYRVFLALAAGEISEAELSVWFQANTASKS
jgi:death-on-curing protein